METTQQHERHVQPTTSDVDVVIVGGGLAGICAAIAAAEKGASVQVLDSAHGGGASAVSGGVIYAGGGTRQQAEAGYGDDTPENMFLYLREEVGDAVDEATLRRFCEESVARMAWLETHGVRFSGSLCPFRTSYPTSDYFLYFSGNERAHPFATIARPAPRGHRVVGAPRGGMNLTGIDLWAAMFDSAMRLGVKFQLASKAEEVLLDGSGNIKGVRYRMIDHKAISFRKYLSLTSRAAKYHGMSMHPVAQQLDRWAKATWERDAEDRTLEARSVILAAGGYIMDKSTTMKFMPWVNRVAPLGTAGDDGSGIRLGQGVGGSVSHMSRFTTWRLMYPPESLVEGIVTSISGERIAAEDLYGASFSNIMVEKHDGRGFLILDSKQWQKVKTQAKTQTQMPWRAFIQYLIYWAHEKAKTLEDLARKLKVDAFALKTTVQAYNNAIINKKPDPVGKLGYRTCIATGPFYGIDISLKPGGMMVVPAMGLGGLRVDGSTGLVLNNTGERIRGLYAAGRNAVGICSNSYISGLALADCVFSGKRAGEHAGCA